jgi:peptidoglycan hydrolase-like protein with peptidoglycan-binding domain
MPMKRCVVVLVISLLGLWPLMGAAGEPGRPGEPPPEQPQRLTKEQIQQVQERLQAEGFDPGPADGLLGPKTEAALRQYQEKQGLPVSGEPDEETLERLQIPPAPGGR